MCYQANLSSQQYVTLNLKRAQRSASALLRFGVIPLALETGHFHLVPGEERKCLLCDLDEVENEIRFTVIFILSSRLKKGIIVCLIRQINVDNICLHIRLLT